MRCASARRPTAHPDLFHPPRREPEWQSLPAAVRQQTKELLAHLLREYHRQSRMIPPGQEMGDE
jgi:hypothetical protein